jgi:hypothetical protein
MWYPWYRTSIRPPGSTTSGALSPPLAGNPGLMCDILVQVLPPSVDFCITTLRSPVRNAQLPLLAQMNVTDVRSGP